MHRTYLTRSDLNPSPCIGTPWQHMHARGNDRAFITTMGIDVATVEYLLAQGFAEAWDLTPIPHNDVSSTGVPRIDHHSLDAAGALGLVLHYLASTMCEISLQQISGLIPSTVTQYLLFSHQILLQVLHKIPSAHIECVMTMLKKVSDFIYFLLFIFSLYHCPEPSRTFYNDPLTSTVTHALV